MQATEIVSKYFISEYYTTLHQDSGRMSRFYDKDSKISFTVDQQHPNVVNGPEGIATLIEECNLQNGYVNLDNGHVSVLPSDEEGMIILVSGQICLSDSKERNFSQVFALDKKKGISGEYYVIKHDMLHIMEIPEVVQEFVEEIVEEEEGEEIPEEIPEEKVEPEEEGEEEEAKPEEMVMEEEEKVEVEVIAEEKEQAEEEEEEKVEEKVVEEEKEEVAMEEEKQVEDEIKPEEEEKKEEEETAITEKELMAEIVQQKEQMAAAAEEKKKEEETPAAPVAGKSRTPAKRPSNFPRRTYTPRDRKQSDRRVEKSSDGFVVETGRFKLQKDRKVESTVYVRFDKDGMNREALIQLFKNEGAIVNVTLFHAKHCAFVDFAEKDTADKLVEKAREEPFRIGEITLRVEKKRERTRTGAGRAPSKKE